MIRDFANAGTEDIYNGIDSKRARKLLPSELHGRAQRKLDDINAVEHYSELALPPSNRLHALKGDRAGQHAIHINDQYRICFAWEGHDAVGVEITDYH